MLYQLSHRGSPGLRCTCTHTQQTITPTYPGGAKGVGPVAGIFSYFCRMSCCASWICCGVPRTLNSFSLGLGWAPLWSSTCAPDWTCTCRIVSPPEVGGKDEESNSSVAAWHDCLPLSLSLSLLITQHIHLSLFGPLSYCS